jgi:hypothetical protein
MSVGNFTLVNSGKEALLSDNAGHINWATDTIVAVLLGASYSPLATHTQYSDVSSHVIADAGYAPVVVSGKTSTRSGDKILWDCDDVNFGNTVTFAAVKYMALFKRAGGALAASDQFIGYVDLNVGVGLTVSSTNAIFKVNTPSGLFDV